MTVRTRFIAAGQQNLLFRCKNVPQERVRLYSFPIAATYDATDVAITSTSDRLNPAR